jgi:predicted ArsR family transcriptional regulator
MIRGGFVSLPEKRHRGGPGRPEQVYSLTERADPMLPGNMPEFALALLGTLEARHGPEWLRKALTASGTRAAAGIHLASAPSSETFVSEVLTALDERGYLAAAGRWSGRRCITFANCPYLEGARLSPAVCAFDQALIEALLQEPVVLFHRLAEHDDHCMFLLGA